MRIHDSQNDTITNNLILFLTEKEAKEMIGALEGYLHASRRRNEAVRLVAVGDSLVHASAVTPDELIDAAASWSGAGCRLARRLCG